MKQYLLNICILFVCISGTLLLPKRGYGQLNGNYTINPTKSASSTNYKNWASAVSDLISGSRTDGGTAQGSGVSGPVTFSVYDTLYNNVNIAITAISGASYSNTITFKSAKGDSSKCRLRYASSTSSTDDYVVLLDGADYITFRQIGFERTGTDTFCTVIKITNDADNNKFLRCWMKGRKKASTGGQGFAYGIGSCFYFLGNADSIQLTQNRMTYGYNGVYNPVACTAATYNGNQIDTSGSAGIYTTGQTSVRIMNNTFNMGDFGANSGGHYTSYGIRIETSPGLLISGNKILMTAVNSGVCRAMVIAANGSSSSSALPLNIYNNYIYASGGTNSCTGLAVYNSFFMNFYYNNVLINNSLADGAAYFQYSVGGTYTNGSLKLVNNNLINKGAGFALDVRDVVNYANIDSLDFNNIYSAGTYMAWWNGTKYTNLSGFQSGSGKSTYSLSLDPGFISNSDLHVSNIAINGKATLYPRVQTDIDNETRDASTPDIGADEFFPIANDAGISGIDSPSLFCAGKLNVKVRFQNYGYDTLKNIQIGWSVNGTPQTGVSWSGKVAPGQSSAAINLGLYSFSGNTAYNFVVWTKNPNSSSDGKNKNDTLKLTRYAAMNGTYTIGDTSIANYKSFSQAITAMTDRGVCGPVTFNVYNGTYNEQVGIAQLPGMSASSPVTFQSISKDSSKVKITLASTVANGNNNAALQLKGADYVTFKGITFERTGTNLYAQVIHILNGSHHNTFTNCQMLGLPLTATNANANNIWSDQSQDNFNTFSNNYIKWGNYGMLYGGNSATQHETGTVIENNTFDGSFNNSLQLSFNDKAIVRGNTFLNVTSALAGNFDLKLNYCDSNVNVNGNYFKSSNTTNSILVNACNASSSRPAFIANNSIVKGTGTGISFDSTNYMSVVYNSFNFTTNLSTNAAISSNGNSSNIIMRNNNIVMSGGEVFHIVSASEVSASNYNNLYARGAEFSYWGGVAYTNFSNFVSASGKDVLSMAVDPLFTSSSDLHIKNPVMKGAGIPVIGISTDIDGELRNATTPDIGADEFKLVPNDAGIFSLLKPVANTCTGLISVEAVIKNTGGDTLKSANITWSVNGVPHTPKSWTGALPTGTKDTFIVGTFNSTGMPSAKFIIKSNLPNGQADGITFNDSIIVTRSIAPLPPANAGTDDTICTGDQIVLGPVNNNAYKYEWTTLSGGFIDSFSQITVKPSSRSSYVLEVTSKALGCSRKDTVTISITSKPTVDAGPDANVCYGSSFQLGKAPQAGFSYSWTSVPSGFTSNLANPVINPVTTTTYTVEKTSNFSGCKATDFAVITVILPPASLISGNSAVCNREKANYTSKANTGNVYQWSVTGGAIEGGQNTNTVSIRWNTAGSGTIRLIETNTFTCKDTVGYNVTVSPSPVAAFADGAACVGSNVPFTNQSTGATSYSWNFGDAGVSTQTNPLHTYTTAGSFNVRLIAKSGNGCYDTIIKPQVINPLPSAAYSIARKFNRSIEFTDSTTITSGNIAKWEWDFGDGDTAMSQNPVHQFKSDATYTIKLCAHSAAGCVNCITKNYNILGVENTANRAQTSLYPNPASGMFRIVSSEQISGVVIYNMVGVTVASFTPDSNDFGINISHLPSGIYMVNIRSANGNEILKLIKE